MCGTERAENYQYSLKKFLHARTEKREGAFAAVCGQVMCLVLTRRALSRAA
jgi:hypothetical protein